VDGKGVPLGGSLASASPAEVTLLEEPIDTIAIPSKGRSRGRNNPRRILAEKGYEGDPLPARLKKRRIDLIAPYRKNNKRRAYHDGRTMRRYKRRWKVERTFAWLQHVRRLIVRHERLITTYRAFFHLARPLIALRRL